MRNWILFKLGDQGGTMTSLTRMLINKYIRKPKGTREYHTGNGDKFSQTQYSEGVRLS